MGRARRRGRRFTGLLPRIGQGLSAAGRWLIRRPQLAIFAISLVGVLWLLWGYAQGTEAFRVSQVVMPAEPAFKLRRPLIGENLWALDIRALADELSAQQPSLKEVRVIRQLPDVVRVEAVQRRPIAQVRIDRWYSVDPDGFVLPGGSAVPIEGLIRLVGFERSGIVLRPGRVNAEERLQLALRVLGLLRRAPAGIARRLTEVNIADPQQIKFLIALSGARASVGAEIDEIEVRCGTEEELSAHLERLRAALKALARQPVAVRYIDVRFQEPVIGPRP